MLRKNILVMFGLVLINSQAALSGVEWPKDVTYEPVSIKMSDLDANGNSYQFENNVVKCSAGYIVGSAIGATYFLFDAPLMSAIELIAIFGYGFIKQPNRLPDPAFSVGVGAGALIYCLAGGVAEEFSKHEKVCTKKTAKTFDKALLASGVAVTLFVIGKDYVVPTVHVYSGDKHKDFRHDTYNCNRLTGICALVKSGK